MRLLVIGRSGQLAQCLARVADAARDVEAVLAGRPQADLADATTLASAMAAARPDVVINAAAYTAVDKAESERDAAFAINATGAGNLAAAASGAGVPLIHVSTDYVYGGTKPAPYVETDPTGPIGVYGASKLEGERLVAACCPRHIIVRTSWVVSPYGSNFCKTMLRLAADRDELRVVSDQIGSPTYAVDLAAALIELARKMAGRPVEDQRWGVYHLANAGTTSWAGLAEATLVASLAHGGRVVPIRHITTAEYPTPARRPANSRLDCTRMAQAFGIAMPPWQDAVERCVSELMGKRT
jgi:dTDP-4-dehydrorhamnose reductase